MTSTGRLLIGGKFLYPVSYQSCFHDELGAGAFALEDAVLEVVALVVGLGAAAEEVGVLTGGLSSF
jgi:hypothetical protein